MHRRKFLQQTAMAGAGVMVAKSGFSRMTTFDDFPVVRIPAGQRKFRSDAV